MPTVHTAEAIDGVRTMGGSILQAAALILQGAMAAAESHEKATTRFQDRTGATRASIKSQRNGLRGFVSAGGVSRFLNFGTKPHEIWARRAKALRFSVNGQILFRSMVHHPGTEPRPFVNEARDHAAAAVEYAAEIYLGRAIGR